MKANVAKDVELKGGDLNSDNVINFDDLTEVVLNYSTDSEVADINGDGIVNFDDLTTIVLNYLAQSVVE